MYTPITCSPTVTKKYFKSSTIWNWNAKLSSLTKTKVPPSSIILRRDFVSSLNLQTIRNIPSLGSFLMSPRITAMPAFYTTQRDGKWFSAARAGLGALSWLLFLPVLIPKSWRGHEALSRILPSPLALLPTGPLCINSPAPTKSSHLVQPDGKRQSAALSGVGLATSFGRRPCHMQVAADSEQSCVTLWGEFRDRETNKRELASAATLGSRVQKRRNTQRWSDGENDSKRVKSDRQGSKF